MNTLADLETKWLARLQEWRDLGVTVNGERIAAEILDDVRAVSLAKDAQTLTLTQAAAITHYHPESIARLIRKGSVQNYGTKARPRVKLAELPRKSAPVAQAAARSPSSVAGNIALDAVAGRIRRSV